MKKKRVETFRNIYGMVTVVYIYILYSECSAFLASGSDPTDDRRRHKV